MPPNSADLGRGKSYVLHRRELEGWMHQHRIMKESREAQNTRRAGGWELLAERASKEMDPEKLISIVLELNRVLDERQRNHFTSD